MFFQGVKFYHKYVIIVNVLIFETSQGRKSRRIFPGSVIFFGTAAFMGLPLSEYLSTTQYCKSSLLMRVSLYMASFQNV